MKTKAAANKATIDGDEDEPKKIRSSRSKRRHRRRSSTESESPPRKRSKKSSKRTADKKSKRSKVSSSSSSRRRRSSSPSPSLSSSSSPSSVSRSCSTCSSSSERSVSPPPRSRSGDVKKRKGRGRDRERGPKRRKARRSTSSRGTSSSGSSRMTRSKSSKRSTKDGSTRHKIEKDYGNRHASLSRKNGTDYFDRDEETLVGAKKGRDYETERYEKNVSLETTENLPYENANETEDILPADGGSPVAEDLELILRQKALENFRKFRAAASMSGKTDNGSTGKEMLTDSPQNAGTKVAEARSAAAPFQGQASSLGVRNPTGVPRSEGCRYGTNRAWKRESSAGTSRGGTGSPRILEDGINTGGPTQQEGRKIEATHSSPQPRSPHDGRNSRSVMQRLVSTPGSATSVKQRLGSSAGVNHVNAAPRIKSVVSIPAREGLDGGATPPQRHHENNSAPVESSSEIKHTPISLNKAEGTNGGHIQTSEASAGNGSTLPSADGKSQVTEATIEDKKDGSQFQKKTFSKTHDGETVEVSYKVYIPKKTPALERRKLQR